MRAVISTPRNLAAAEEKQRSDFQFSYLGLLALLEEGVGASLLLGLLGGEVLWLGDLVNLLLVEAGDVDLVGGGNDVSGVDAAEGDAVDLEGAGDQQDTLLKVLEEDDALATEAAGEEDQDGAGLERLAGRPGADSLADLCVEKTLVSKRCPQSYPSTQKKSNVIFWTTHLVV